MAAMMGPDEVRYHEEEEARQGWVAAYKDETKRFNTGRVGGFFQIDLPPMPNWADYWDRIVEATERQLLGYRSACPSADRNAAYAMQFRKNPLKYSFYIHTDDASDLEEVERILIELFRLGFESQWIRTYRSYRENETRRVLSGRSPLNFHNN